MRDKVAVLLDNGLDLVRVCKLDGVVLQLDHNLRAAADAFFEKKRKKFFNFFFHNELRTFVVLLKQMNNRASTYPSASASS